MRLRQAELSHVVWRSEGEKTCVRKWWDYEWGGKEQCSGESLPNCGHVGTNMQNAALLAVAPVAKHLPLNPLLSFRSRGSEVENSRDSPPCSVGLGTHQSSVGANNLQPPGNCSQEPHPKMYILVPTDKMMLWQLARDSQAATWCSTNHLLLFHDKWLSFANGSD